MTEPKPMPSAPPPRLPRPVGHGELVHLLQYAHRTQWALNSAVECHLHTVEVIGSNPIAPTIPAYGLPHVVLLAWVHLGPISPRCRAIGQTVAL